MTMPEAAPSTTTGWGTSLGRRGLTYVLPFVVLAALWQFGSLFFPPFLFPSLVDVFKRCFDILTSWSQLADVLATVGRILAGLAGAETLKLGGALRFFGDGFQVARRLGDKRYWRIPVMDGEFVCEATTGLTKAAVGGGNLIVMGGRAETTLAAAEAAVAAIDAVPDAIMPFPGGIARSGSKVGAKYKGMIASTNDAYCPTLKGSGRSELDADIASVLEIVIDGLTSDAVAGAMRAGLAAIVALGPERGALRVGAGNYGGKLGPHHYHLKDLLP